MSSLRLQRTASLVVFVVYIGMAYHQGGGGSALASVPYMLLPLACIWFADELSDYRGWGNFRLVTRMTPEGLIRLAGWALLLLPFWAPLLGGCLGISAS